MCIASNESSTASTGTSGIVSPAIPARVRGGSRPARPRQHPRPPRPEDRQELRRSGEGLLASGENSGEKLGVIEPVRLVGLCGFRHLADHREHRSLDWMADGAIRGIARRAERPCQRGHVDRVVVPPRTSANPRTTWLKITPEFPRAPISAARDELAGELLVPGGGGLLQRVDDRCDGEREVRAGVAVGHRIDVQIVDPLPVRLEVAESGAGNLAGAVDVHAARLDDGTARRRYADEGKNEPGDRLTPVTGHAGSDRLSAPCRL